jgi:rhodanese-related sulfurtransferase
MDLYNTVVDGLAGFLVVDLRSAEEYDEEHVWGAVLNILFFYFYFFPLEIPMSDMRKSYRKSTKN